MSLYDEIQQILGNKKMQKVAKERLHPPMAPKKENYEGVNPQPNAVSRILPLPIASETAVSPTLNGSASDTRKGDVASKLAIDLGSMPTEYWQYCDCNDAKRNWIRVKFGMSHRGTTAQLKRDVKKIQSNLNLIKRMPPEVMAELKLKIRGRKDE